MPRTGSVQRLPFPMSRTDYSPLPLTCFTQDRLGLHRSFGFRLPANMPAADFCRPLSTDHSMLSRHLSVSTGRQISRGKFDRLQHTTGGSTLCALMEQHFVAEGPLVPATDWPHIRFLFIGSCFCSALLPDPPHGCSPCASLPFTSIWLVEDFHLQAVEHARHTFSRPSGVRRHGGEDLDED